MKASIPIKLVIRRNRRDGEFDLMESLGAKPEPYGKRKSYSDDKLISLFQSNLKREWERVKIRD